MQTNYFLCPNIDSEKVSNINHVDKLIMQMTFTICGMNFISMCITL